MWASAARADTYLVISLVGDRLTIFGAQQQAGSHMATTGKEQVVPLKDSQFDDFAVRTAGTVIGKALPGATVTLLRAKDPELYKMRNAWLDADSIDVRGLVDLIKRLFDPPPDSHLLLITPLRDELQLATDRAHYGKGTKGAGLGFYVDGATLMHDESTTGVGFLGVFTNFQIVLINLRDNGVEAQERVVVGTTFPAASAPDRTPWNALTADRKVDALKYLLKREIDRSLPGMLSAKR